MEDMTDFRSFAARMSGSESIKSERLHPLAQVLAKSVSLTLLFLPVIEYVFRRLRSIGLNLCAIVKIDGVVESPIYCVAEVFQKLGILHVLPRL